MPDSSPRQRWPWVSLAAGVAVVASYTVALELDAAPQRALDEAIALHERARTTYPDARPSEQLLDDAPPGARALGPFREGPARTEGDRTLDASFEALVRRARATVAQRYGLAPGEPRISSVALYVALHRSPAHLFVNLVLLAALGAALERRKGPVITTIVLVVAWALSTTLVVALEAGGPVIGASGVAAGLAAALALLGRGVPRGVGLAVAFAFTVAAGLGWPPELSHFAHLGGLLGGGLVALGVSILERDAARKTDTLSGA